MLLKPTSRISSGSEPNFRHGDQRLCLAGGEPAGAAGDLCPAAEARRLDGRCGHDLAVEDDGELLAVVVGGVLVEEARAGVLQLQVHHDLTGGAVLGDGRAGDLDAGEQRLDVLHALRQRPFTHQPLQLGRHGHELEDAGGADEVADVGLFFDARKLDGDAVRTLGDDDGLGYAGGVDPVLDDGARLLEDLARDDLVIGRHDLVLAAQGRR